MIRAMSVKRDLFVWGLLVVVGITPAAAAEWPKDYVVQKETNSPDGKFAIIVRSRESVLESESTHELDDRIYLADISPHQVVGEIKGIEYFQGQNHRDLKARWASDSRECVVEDYARFGF